MEDLLRIVREAATLEVFNYIHAAAIVTNGGHLLKKESSLTAASQFSAIVRVARPYIGKMKERALANFMWALGCSGRKLITADEKDILEELIGASRLTLDNFNAQDASNTAWSLAVMEHDDPVFMTQLLAAATPKLPGFSPQALSNLAYALAKQKQRGAPDPQGLEVFLGELVLSAAEQLGCFSAQALSNTSWALGVLGYRDLNFLSRVQAICESGEIRLSPREKVNMKMWLAKLS